MSLLDALLLDSYRMNLWVAYGTDGVARSGTQSDPFNGSTQAKFDALMNAVPMAFSSITNVSLTPSEGGQRDNSRVTTCSLQKQNRCP